jgi:hypothetical protein
MTPKEKAKKIVDKYMPHIAGADRYNTTLGIYNKDIAKKCALIAVDEVIESVNDEHVSDIFIEFWEEVKKEIELL